MSRSTRQAAALALAGIAALTTAGVAAGDEPVALTAVVGEPATVEVGRGDFVAPAGSGDPLAEVRPWAVVKRATVVAERESGALGTYHPVAGSVDYGDSDAGFGAARDGHVHEGQDLFAPAGTELVAVSDGTVLEAGSDADRGNHLAIYSADANQTYVYFHMLSSPEVEVGEGVRGGEAVGELGCTGSCYGDHLHFEVHEGEGAETPAIDPLPLLEGWRKAG